MIVTCPSCDTRYNLTAQQVGPKGRKIRCASCQHEWQQPPLEIEESTPKPPLPPQSQFTHTPSDAEILSKKWITLGIGLVVTVVLILLGSLIWLLKDSSSTNTIAAYSNVYSSNSNTSTDPIYTPTGLVMSGIERDVVEDANLTILLFRGKVTNTNSTITHIPEIRVQLLDKKGIELDFWPADIQKTTLKPGETTPWTVRFLNPPLDRIHQYKAFFKN